MLYSFFFRRLDFIICCGILTFSKQPSSGTNPLCLLSNLMFFGSRLSQIFAYNRMKRLPIVIGCQSDGFLRLSTVLGIRVVLHSLALSGMLFLYHLFRIAVISSNINNFKSDRVIKSRPGDVSHLNFDTQSFTSSGVITP